MFVAEDLYYFSVKHFLPAALDFLGEETNYLTSTMPNVIVKYKSVF